MFKIITVLIAGSVALGTSAAGYLIVAKPVDMPAPAVEVAPAIVAEAEAVSSLGFYERMTLATVRIDATALNFAGVEAPAWTGSGWAIRNADGGTYIVTNRHITEGGISFKVMLGTNRYAIARLVGQHERHDLAVLFVLGEPMQTLAIAAVTPRVGDTVYAIGAPFRYEDTITRGIVSFVHRVIDDEPGLWIQTDCPVNPGNSGGPLVNEDGEVIAVNTLGYGNWDSGINFSIAAVTIREAILDIELDAGVRIL